MSLRWKRRWWMPRLAEDKLEFFTDAAVWQTRTGSERANVGFEWTPGEGHSVSVRVFVGGLRVAGVMVDRDMLANGGGEGDVRVAVQAIAVRLDVSRAGVYLGRIYVPINVVRSFLRASGRMVAPGEERTPFAVSDQRYEEELRQLAGGDEAEA